MTETSTRSRRLASVLMAGFGATLMFLTAPTPALAQSAAGTSAVSHDSVKPPLAAWHAVTLAGTLYGCPNVP